MSTANNTKALKAFVKSKINNNLLFPINKTTLIDNIVYALENERVTCIEGASGTGKDYLVNKVFIPHLKKNYDIHRIDARDKLLISEDNVTSLSNADNKLLFVCDELLTPTNIALDSNGTFDKIREIRDNGCKINLPNIQDQFLDFPTIIESFTLKLYNKPIDKLMVGIVGYIEILICGLPKNFESLKNIIMSEPPSDYEKEMSLKYSNIGYISTFNSYLDNQVKRKNIWRSFWKCPNNVELKNIVSFNEPFLRHGINTIIQQSSGPSRKHPYSRRLEKIKIYCRSLLQKYNAEVINEQIFEPIDSKIKMIESGEYSNTTKIDCIFLFQPKQHILYKYNDNSKFKHGDEFQIVELDGQRHHLTANQASVLKYIYTKFSDGEEFVGSKVLHRSHTKSTSLWPIFRVRPKFFYRFFICINKKSGIYRIHPDFLEKIPSS